MHIIVYTKNKNIRSAFEALQLPSVEYIIDTDNFERIHTDKKILFILAPDIYFSTSQESINKAIRTAFYKHWRVTCFCKNLDDNDAAHYFDLSCDDVLTWLESPQYLLTVFKNIEKRFAQSRKKITTIDSTILNNVNIVPWEFDVEERRFNYFGRNILNILGYPNENWIEADFHYKLVHPSDLELVQESYQNIVQYEAKNRELRYRMIALDGRVVWVRNLISTSKSPHTGKLLLSGLLTDVSGEESYFEHQLKAKEKLMEDLLKHINMAPIAVLNTNADLVITSWSKGAQDIFGITAEKAEGSPWGALGLIHKDDEQSVIEQLTPLMDGETSYQEVYNRNIAADGSVVHMHWMNSCLRNPDGSLQSLLSMGRDITAEMLDKEKTRELDKMNAIVTLSEGIAHDFNNLLTPILFNAESITKNISIPKDAIQAGAIVKDQALKARDLLRIMANLSKPLKADWQTIVTENFIKDIQKALNSVLSPQVSLSITAAADIPDFMGDETLLYDALHNLIKNSYHAYEENSGLITLSIKANNRTLSFTVSDHGKGIEKANQNSIFTPFFTTKKSTNGTGLGLAMVKKIAEAHDGDITLDYSNQNGTAFSINIPYKKPITTQQTNTTVKLRESHTKNALILDEEEHIIFTLEKMLEILDYQTSNYYEIDTILNLLDKDANNYDLIIISQKLLQEIKTPLSKVLEQKSSILPIIVITNSALDSFENLPIGLNLFATLTKPFTFTEFKLIIEKL